MLQIWNLTSWTTMLKIKAVSVAFWPVWYSYVKSRSLSAGQMQILFYSATVANMLQGWQNILSSSTKEYDSLCTHCSCLCANPFVVVGPGKWELVGSWCRILFRVDCWISQSSLFDFKSLPKFSGNVYWSMSSDSLFNTFGSYSF